MREAAEGNTGDPGTWDCLWECCKEEIVGSPRSRSCLSLTLATKARTQITLLMIRGMGPSLGEGETATGSPATTV